MSTKTNTVITMKKRKTRASTSGKVPTVHQLKTWPNFFNEILSGIKPFEFRYDDRGFKVGDILLLQEWDPKKKSFTGNAVEKKVTYILRCDDVGACGWVVMTWGGDF